MTISLRMNEEDAELIKKYAALNRMSVSEFMRQAALERIEDEYDIQLYEEAIAEYRANPVTLTHEELLRRLENDE